MLTFKNRADAFWKWFAVNEGKLGDMLSGYRRANAAQILDFASKGAELIADGLRFGLSGERVFSFSPSGRESLYYLLPWLISRMPGQYKDKWKFFPSMPGAGGANLTLEMYGKHFEMKDVWVRAAYDVDKGYFLLSFYHVEFPFLEEEEAYHAFYTLLDSAVGESFSRLYVGDAQLATYQASEAFPLTELEEFMREALFAYEQEILDGPEQRYLGYAFTPKEGKTLRFDVRAGVTNFMTLIDEYYEASRSVADDIESLGAKVLFLVFPWQSDKDDAAAMLDLRYELEERIQEEVLGEKGSGEELGMVLGGAMGNLCVYIDILLYHAPNFEERLIPLLAEYPYRFYLSPFEQRAALVDLNTVEYAL